MIKIRTERLDLYEGNESHAEFIFRLLNSPPWIQFIGDRDIKNLDDAKDYIDRALMKSYKENGFGMYIVHNRAANVPMGLCGLLQRDELSHPDIGFAILPEYTKQGYTYEAARAVIEFSKENLGIDVVYGITGDENTKSKKLLEKLGLKYKHHFQFGNYEEESMLFSNKPHES